MFLDHALERGSITPAAGKFLTALQDDDVFAAVYRDQLFDLPHIDDRGSVNANEVVGIQPFGYPADGFPVQMRFLSDV
jgi:hypothetical protein